MIVDPSSETNPDFGPCCSCEKTGADVRNVIMWEKRCPTPGRGWSCVVCGLPADGAVVVLCDACLDQEREPRFACVGYPGQDGHVPIETLQGEFRHDLRRHREILKQDDLSFLDEKEGEDEGRIPTFFIDDE